MENLNFVLHQIRGGPIFWRRQPFVVLTQNKNEGKKIMLKLRNREKMYDSFKLLNSVQFNCEKLKSVKLIQNVMSMLTGITVRNLIEMRIWLNGN